MKILDLRPWPTKLAHSLWQNQVEVVTEQANASNSTGFGLGTLISKISRARLQNRPQVPTSPFIVSVGNLALGGTGKTPVVSALAVDLAKLGYSGAILTRGYRSPLAGPVVVKPDLVNAGDEARLLAKDINSSGWLVVQARNRLEGLNYLKKQVPTLDIVIAEDAFQTPNLPRHFDILILDRWQVGPEKNRKTVNPTCGPIFPFGPYREDSQGAQRANVWLLEDSSNELLHAPQKSDISVATFSRKVMIPSITKPSLPYGVLSGIARPWRFEKSMTQQMGYTPALAVRCNDHDSYGPNLVRKIVVAAKEANVGTVLTTAKDWVKLQDVWPADFPLQVAELKIIWGNGKTLPELVKERLLKYSQSR